MAIATGSQSQAAYVAESTYGVTPTNPTMQKVCHTGSTLQLSKEAIESGCLNDSRQISDSRHGNNSCGGDLSYELAYGEYDDLLEAALMGTWTSNVLKAGKVRRSFTIERAFVGIDAPEYHRYAGSEVNSWSLSVTPNSMVESSFGIISQSLDSANLTSQVAGATYTDETGNAPFDSFTGTIQEGGSNIGVVTQLDMALENGLESSYVLMSKNTIEPGSGKSRVAGTMTVFYESAALALKFINETSSTLALNLTDLAGNSLLIELPNIKYNGGSTPDVSGEGNVSLSMPFIAIYDNIEDSQIKITRTPA